MKDDQPDEGNPGPNSARLTPAMRTTCAGTPRGGPGHGGNGCQVRAHRAADGPGALAATSSAPGWFGGVPDFFSAADRLVTTEATGPGQNPPGTRVTEAPMVQRPAQLWQAWQ